MNVNSRRLRRLGLSLLLWPGLAGAAVAQGVAQFDGQYRGELTLTRVIRGDCTRPPPGALYPLTISAGEVRFAYIPRFSTTLTGRVDERGNIKAAARLRKGAVEMTGRIQRSHITAFLVSPSCNYTFQTKD